MKKIVSALVLGLFIANITACSTVENKATPKETKIPIQTVQASFAIDFDNPKEVVGHADQTFVGFVNKKLDTVYTTEGTLATQGGKSKMSSPYTNYEITVIDNLKGHLKKNTAIPMKKAGGLAEDGKSYSLFEEDSLPQEGKYYLFQTLTQPDGELLISGPNTNIALNVQSKSEIVKSPLYKDYKKAVKQQVKFDREHFTSDYDYE